MPTAAPIPTSTQTSIVFLLLQLLVLGCCLRDSFSAFFTSKNMDWSLSSEAFLPKTFLRSGFFRCWTFVCVFYRNRAVRDGNALSLREYGKAHADYQKCKDQQLGR